MLILKILCYIKGVTYLRNLISAPIILAAIARPLQMCSKCYLFGNKSLTKIDLQIK